MGHKAGFTLFIERILDAHKEGYIFYNKRFYNMKTVIKLLDMYNRMCKWGEDDE